MNGRNVPSLPFERIVAPGSALPERPENRETNARLDFVVIFTGVDPTAAALRQAGALACSLNARIILLVPQVVPYPLPLENPPMPIDFNERRLRALARESPVEIAVRVYLCRDRLQTLETALGPHSLVVLGGRKRWWPTEEKSLAKKLRRAGHDVIFTELK